MKNPTSRRAARPFRLLPLVVAFAALLLAGRAHAQFDPMVGLSVSSYSIQGNVPTDPLTTTLSFQSSSNPSFNPSMIAGDSTGDAVGSTNWAVEAVGLDFTAFAPTAGNLIGIQLSRISGSTDTTDSLSGTFTLVFSNAVVFNAVNPSIGLLDNVTPSNADLTPTAGPALDLLTTPSGTVLPAGQYTLAMSGMVNTATSEAAAMAVSLSAVPEPALAAFLSGLAVLALIASRRRE